MVPVGCGVNGERRLMTDATRAAFLSMQAAATAPGYSEHHTGQALDFASIPDELPFPETGAFRWLCDSARRFRFTLSYPPDNPFGLVYEPWHWRHQSE